MNTFDMQGLFEVSDINEKTQSYLSKVYSILSTGVIVSGISGLLAAREIVPYSVFYFLMIASFISEIVHIFIRHSKFAKEKLSPASFYASTIAVGGLLGTFFIDLSLQETRELKSVMMSAFIITAALFASITVFSLITVRRHLIFFGSLISSLVLSIVSIFLFRSSALYSIIGVVVGSLYIVVDTQMMIHKFESGIEEPYQDARQLFYDLVKIMIEIMKYLGKDKENKKKN